MTTDILNDNSLNAALRKNGVNIGSAVVQCASTQQYSRGVSVAEDTVFVASNQSEGRGRLDRRFVSLEGGCYFTLVTELEGNNPLSFVPLISVAVATVMLKYGIDAHVKWPNDILVGGKKICGILSNADAEYAYLGVGINVFNDISGISDIAVSMYGIGVKNISRAEIIADVLKEFYMLRKREFSEILSLYEKYLNIYGRDIAVRQGEKIIEGTVCGISSEGFLLLENEQGTVVVMSGDVTLAD